MGLNETIDSWSSPDHTRLPDFIIGGAMKSGTSTLHAILAKHPDVFIPRREVNFFDIDNILQHPDFNFYENKKWYFPDMLQDRDKVWNWYFDKFSEGEGKLIGEDSTTYLASPKVAERIAVQKKQIKMIFILRHPTARAYSNYNHLVKSGRAVYSFEDTIKYAPFDVLNRSLYKEQLEYYYKFLDRENIKVLLFEEMVENLKETVLDVANFLSLDTSKFSEDVFSTHANPARIPGNISLQLKRNNMIRGLGNRAYSSLLPLNEKLPESNAGFKDKVINKVHSTINPLKAEKPPKMEEETRAFLNRYFKSQLEGIDELVGKEILSKWF